MNDSLKGGYVPSKDPECSTPPGQRLRQFKDTEILMLSRELAQRYPDTYGDLDKPFAFWVSECQQYAIWKETHDWDVVRDDWVVAQKGPRIQKEKTDGAVSKQ